MSGHLSGRSRLSGKSRGDAGLGAGGQPISVRCSVGQSGSSIIYLTVWAGGPAVSSAVGGREGEPAALLRRAANGRHPASCASRLAGLPQLERAFPEASDDWAS